MSENPKEDWYAVNDGFGLRLGPFGGCHEAIQNANWKEQWLIWRNSGGIMLNSGRRYPEPILKEMDDLSVPDGWRIIQEIEYMPN